MSNIEFIGENSMAALRTLSTFLEEDEWHPQPMEKHVFRMGFAGKNVKLSCFAQIRVDKEQFLFYVMAPVTAPEDLRPVVAEFITRANWGLRIGNLELDYSDGQIRYKSSLDFEGFVLEKRMIRNAMYPAVQTMDRYMPGIMGILYGGKSALEAIALVEG